VIVVFVVNGTSRTIPTVESYGAEVFVPARTDLAVKLLRIARLTMGDSIGDSIVTPYITNLSGKDLNRCQMTRIFFWPDMFLGYVLSFLRRS